MEIDPISNAVDNALLANEYMDFLEFLENELPDYEDLMKRFYEHQDRPYPNSI